MHSFLRTTRCLAVSFLALSCALSLHAQAITVRDGAGQNVTLPAPARRIASLMSSAVDIVVALGGAERIAARTRYDTASAVSGAVNGWPQEGCDVAPDPAAVYGRLENGLRYVLLPNAEPPKRVAGSRASPDGI